MGRSCRHSNSLDKDEAQEEAKRDTVWGRGLGEREGGPPGGGVAKPAQSVAAAVKGMLAPCPEHGIQG